MPSLVLSVFLFAALMAFIFPVESSLLISEATAQAGGYTVPYLLASPNRTKVFTTVEALLHPSKTNATLMCISQRELCVYLIDRSRIRVVSNKGDSKVFTLPQAYVVRTKTSEAWLHLQLTFRRNTTKVFFHVRQQGKYVGRGTLSTKTKYFS
eukprot:PhF_6_TR973/c1_g1_i5/m.1885